MAGKRKKQKRSFLDVEFDKKVRVARVRAIHEAGCGCRVDDASCGHISSSWRRRINILKNTRRGPIAIGLYGLRAHEGFWAALDRTAEMPKHAPSSPRVEAQAVLDTLRAAAARNAFKVSCKCPPWEECEHIDYQDKRRWFDRYTKLKALRRHEIGSLLPAVGSKDVWTLLDRLGGEETNPDAFEIKAGVSQTTTDDPANVMLEL